MNITTSTTKIIRFSPYAFNPQIQTHHMEYIDYCINDFNINDFPSQQRYILQKTFEKRISFYKEHYNDFKEGIWFFLDGHKNNQSLNHLKHKVPCYEAEIENDVEIYDCNLEYLTTLDDSFVKFAGCYLPKREIHKIHNIKRRIFNKEKI